MSIARKFEASVANSVAFSEFGDRANPSILLLHGIRLGREIWEPHARALAAEYHVVTLDLPGHGALSHVPFESAAIEELMETATASVCASPPVVVGYSLGGYVAIDYASRRPERTRGLLLSGCTIDFESWKRWPYEAGARFTQLVPGLWLDKLFDLTLHLTLPPAWATLVSRIPFDPSVIASTSSLAHTSSRFSEKLARYKRPVLVVNGEYDVVFRLDERRFLTRIPHARLRVVRRADHIAPMRYVEEFTSIVRDFAGDVLT
jgi:pimeloyl-ACP methyl ester carboxylesterase